MPVGYLAVTRSGGGAVKQSPIYRSLVQEHELIHQEAKKLIDSGDSHDLHRIDDLYDAIIYKMNKLIEEIS